MGLKRFESIMGETWFKNFRNEFFDNNNGILWGEAGLVTLMFCHLRNKIPEYSRRYLLIPEYRPTVPKSAVCKNEECKKVLEKYNKNEKKKVDLCLVEFGVDLEESKKEERRECNFWCYKPTPIIAMEFKYKWHGKELEKDVKNDTEKLNMMVKDWGTKLAYLIIITDFEDEEFNTLYKKYLDIVKEQVEKDIREKFRLAIGSWRNKEFWRIDITSLKEFELCYQQRLYDKNLYMCQNTTWH